MTVSRFRFVERGRLYRIMAGPSKNYPVLTRELFGGVMSRKSLLPLMVAAFLCSIFVFSVDPARSQGRGQGRGQAPTLPDGPGKEMVQTSCTKCHGANLIVNSGGYTRQGWEDLFNTMVAVPKEESIVMADYLAKNFPEQP